MNHNRISLVAFVVSVAVIATLTWMGEAQWTLIVNKLINASIYGAITSAWNYFYLGTARNLDEQIKDDNRSVSIYRAAMVLGLAICIVTG